MVFSKFSMNLFGKYVNEISLGNFRKDNDEINARFKLWSKTADVFTHEYYELRKFVTEF
jgi:hypothetical protein